MEAGSPIVTERKSGAWVNKASPLDPEIMRKKYKVKYKHYESFS
jgi:hypothetical protein